MKKLKKISKILTAPLISDFALEYMISAYFLQYPMTIEFIQRIPIILWIFQKKKYQVLKKPISKIYKILTASLINYIALEYIVAA